MYEDYVDYVFESPPAPDAITEFEAAAAHWRGLSEQLAASLEQSSGHWPMTADKEIRDAKIGLSIGELKRSMNVVIAAVDHDAAAASREALKLTAIRDRTAATDKAADNA
jgi:hypothetical protein